jgi:hypothetical protein
MFSNPPNLVNYNGKNISEICPFSIGKDNGTNHCAHFVSHMMDYDFLNTCKNYTLLDKTVSGSGANIRVNELFNRCTTKREWDAKPDELKSCLMFVTVASNVTQLGTGLFMKDGPAKHVGIFMNDTVWNYSNSHDKVVADDLALFKRKFSGSYRKFGLVSFYYGEFIK